MLIFAGLQNYRVFQLSQGKGYVYFSVGVCKQIPVACFQMLNQIVD